MKYFAILIGLAVMSCGVSKRGSQLQADLPDNYAIRSSCYALSQDLKQPILVASDDGADIRLCANVQKDGHLGLDLRYQSLQKNPGFPIYALVTLQDGKGRSSSETFRMEANPLAGNYQLYLTDGCLIGSFGGCSQTSQKKMQQLFDVLNNRERSNGFEVNLAFGVIKSDQEAQWDLHNPLKKQSYRFEIKDL